MTVVFVSATGTEVGKTFVSRGLVRALKSRGRTVEVLKPVRWTSVRRNEVVSVVSTTNAIRAMTTGKGNLHIAADDPKERAQRASLILRDVAYRLHAELEFLPARAPHDTAAKYAEMFRRRASKGQCVNQPYLGCREFAARFRLIDANDAAPPPVAEVDGDLGWMLHDMDFSNPADPRPTFFRANIKHGVLDLNGIEVRG